MSNLTAAELRSRRHLDFTLLAAMATPLWSFRAFPSASAWSRGDPPTAPGADGGGVTFYEVIYAVRVLVDHDEYSSVTRVTFDASSPGYPFTAPAVTVTTTGYGGLPWNSHVAHSGAVCLGPIWAEARGRMLLCQLVLHVCKVLNLDEPAHDEDGYDADAHDYWANVLDYQPITPGLQYPLLPRAAYDGSLVVTSSTVPPPSPSTPPPAFRVVRVATPVARPTRFVIATRERPAS